ncbi:lateendosome to vacuole transport-family protein [Moesziomyces antarcticus]|uniref:Uncharacterized protein n=2 Tax=Pseudozyma antarctica TaxID=84753 RepID=A0A5C3FM86_PSEA2|nr:lateendosome to vacuole transport-family protein [Moesziomyces antarcticus]GAK65842.1 lateendosome to vacuole transport-family protein [Moesziomyces antarcticus]SPO45472.1 uncharacterized protein PSANT_03158 [Moesziomyces antarcticus]
MQRNGSAESNPWDAEPSYAQRISTYHADQHRSYDQQMQDVLDSPPTQPPNGLHHDALPSTSKDAAHDDLDDDDDDDFVYAGIDTAANIHTATPDDSNASIDLGSDSYSARMKDILGSDDEQQLDVADADDQHAGSSDHAAASSPRTQRALPLPADGDQSADAPPSDSGSSFRYPHPLPNDVSFDTRSASSLQNRHPLSSLPSSSRIFTPRSTSANGLSLLRQSHTMTSASTPQRPNAYPSLSRLRATVGRSTTAALAVPAFAQLQSSTSPLRTPGSPSSSSPRRKPRSPLPPDFFAPAPISSRDDDASRSAMAHSSTPQRSRQSSFSTSVSGSVLGTTKCRRARASFPYGGTLTSATLPPAQSEVSLLSDRSFPSSAQRGAKTVHEQQHAPSEDAEKRPELKETMLNERDELARDFVQWSVLRRVLAAAKSAPDAPDPIPTVLAVAGGLIAVGTQGGKTVVCDLAQDPIASCGHDGRGHGDAVTALALSSDHSFLGVGHASGNIFLYDLSHPARAARHVPPVPLSSVKAGKREGHLSGSAIVHMGFVGLRHTAIVSADNKGLAFYHALGKVLGVSSNDTLRLLGKYPQYEHEDELGLADARSRSVIFQLTPLPLGPRPHAADETTFIAMITPAKMVLVGLKPTPRTWYRKVHTTKHAEKGGEGVVADEAAQSQQPGCLAWYPASTETDGKRKRQTNPVLAFSFGRNLHLVRLVVRRIERRPDVRTARNGALPPAEVVDEIEPVELTGEQGIEEPDGIVALQWFSPDLLMLTTRTGLALFDCRAGKVTERMRNGSAAVVLARTVEQKSLDAVLLGKPYDPHSETPEAEDQGQAEERQRSWAVNHSIRVSKGRSFFLTTTDLVVGTLLSWADRLLLYVSRGDFLSAIELATLFHQGRFLGSAVGLPSDPGERTRIVADKLHELMAASAQYAFSPDRLTDDTHVTPDGRGVDRTELFQGLASVCARACLSLGKLDFLFETLYDKYEDNGIEAIFVGQMEDFIVSGELSSLPIPVVQRLVAFRRDREEYDQAERIIWHVDPKSLDLDQALSLCLDRRLYDALIYVFNAALDDYVSPIIELLHPVRRALGRRWKEQHLVSEDEASADTDPYAHIRIQDHDADAAVASPAVADWEAAERDLEDGYRVFSYLSVVLTGNRYPSQEPFEHAEQADKAKGSIYNFVFSGSCMLWPPGPGGRLVLYGLQDRPDEPEHVGDTAEHEPIYPYLRLLLEFDAEALLDALDLAFEDGFLDDEDVVGKRISRQLAVDVLLELAGSQGASDRRAPALPLTARVFVHIFVARNAPKYPQFIHLPQHHVDQLLRSLAIPLHDGDGDVDEVETVESTRADRELAAECLLSHYKPRFDDAWLDTFERAGFGRILRSAFRQEDKWDRLLGMYLRDHLHGGALASQLDPDAPDDQGPGDAFAHFEETLFNASRRNTRGRNELVTRLHEQLVDHIAELLDLDALKTAAMLDRFHPDRHAQVLQRLAQLDDKRHLLYLQCFFEPMHVRKAVSQPRSEELSSDGLDWVDHKPVDGADAGAYSADGGRADADHLDACERQVYLDLLRRYEPAAVVRNLDARAPGYFDLEQLVRACRDADGKDSRVAANSDALLWALDRLGRPDEAFEELDAACVRTAQSLVLVADAAAAEVLLADVRRCIEVAVRLCIERANAFGGHESDDDAPAPAALDTDEVWFRLLRSMVRLVHDVAHGSSRRDDPGSKGEEKDLLNGVRDIVQDTLSDLISSTAAEAVSFPALFRRLTTPAEEGKQGGAEYYAEIRGVLDGMLSAYHLRAELLGITNKLFERDTFRQFRKLHAQRRHGWRPSIGVGARCASCGVVVLGPKRGSTGAAEVDVGREEVGGAMLTPQVVQHRRAKSPYDGKAAPLASPRMDKGKGVVRSASSEIRAGADDVDGYFAPSREMSRSSSWANGGASALMTRTNSTASIAIRINDEPPKTQEPEQHEETEEEEEGDATLTAAQFMPAWQEEEGEERRQRIVVQKCGRVFHESCWHNRRAM